MRQAPLHADAWPSFSQQASCVTTTGALCSLIFTATNRPHCMQLGAWLCWNTCVAATCSHSVLACQGAAQTHEVPLPHCCSTVTQARAGLDSLARSPHAGDSTGHTSPCKSAASWPHLPKRRATVSNLGMTAWSPMSTPEALPSSRLSQNFFTAAASIACSAALKSDTWGCLSLVDKSKTEREHSKHCEL